MHHDAEERLTPFVDVLVLQGQINLLLAEAMQEVELSPHAYAVYSVIDLNPGITVTRLAAEFLVPLTTVSDWVAGYTRQGHLLRERSAEDGRSFSLRLTDAGEAARGEARAAFGVAYLAFLAGSSTSPEQMRVVLGDMIEGARSARETLGQLPRVDDRQ
ncbi:MAG: hypothetical protein ACTH2Q_05705 [Propionibacteriaceae bacterium]